jgi:Dip2/Utp12 Family
VQQTSYFFALDRFKPSVTGMAGGRLPPTLSPSATSRAGRHAAVLRPDGSVVVYDALSRTVSPPSTSAPGVIALVLAPNRARVAAHADRDGRVFLGPPGPAAKVVAVLPDGGRPPVLDATAHVVVAAGGASRDLVVVATETSVAHTLSVSRLHRNPISAVAIAPGGRSAVVCCQAVSLVEVATGSAVRMFTGHQTPVTSVAFLPLGPDVGQVPANSIRFVTACSGDQFISIWDAPANWCVDVSADLPIANDEPLVAGSSKKRRNESTASAIHTLIAPEKGVRNLIVDSLQNLGASTVAAILPSGSIAVWSNWALLSTVDAASAPHTTKPSFVVRPAAGDVVLFATFVKPGVLAIARGHPLSPTFFSVNISDMAAKPDVAEVVMSAADTRGLLAVSKDAGSQDHSRRRRSRHSAASLLAKADANVSLVVKDAAPDLVAEEASKQKGVKVRREAEEAQNNEIENSEDEGEESEPTMQEKLAGLGVFREASAGSKLGAAGVVRGRSDDVGARSAGDVNNRPIGSVANLLTQAIQTKDHLLFDSVIETSTSQRQIRQSINLMPVSLATREFLDLLVTRLVERPARARSLMPWIREILIEHAGTLMAQGRSLAFHRLMNAIDCRVESLSALNRLEGRLQLVVAQADRVRLENEKMLANTRPAVEYTESKRLVNGGIDDECNSSTEEPSDEEDAEETGDFSEDDSNSSVWLSEGDGDAEDEEDDNALADANGKSKALNGFNMMDMSASEGEDEAESE